MIKSPPVKKSVSQTPGTLHPLVIASALGVILLAVVLIAWQTARAGSASSRPDLPVHAGMYQLRQELQNSAAAKPGAGKSVP